MSKRTAVILLTAIVILGICIAIAGSESGQRTAQGGREYDICMKQADRTLRTHGSAAYASAVNDCVSSYKNGTY